MTEKIDNMINAYTPEELAYYYKNYTFFPSGYVIGRTVFLNGTVNDRQRLPFPPVNNDLYFLGTSNEDGNQYVVKVTTKGRIETKGKNVTVFGLWTT